MGLLDYGFEDPNTAGLLSLGLRLMSTPGKFGTALGSAGLGAMGDMQRARAQQQDRQQAAQRQQLFELQMKQAQQAQADAEARRELAKKFAMTPEQMAVSQNGGPTMAAAAATRNTAPGYNYQGYAQGLAEMGDITGALAVQQATTKDKTFTMGPKDRLFERGTNRLLIGAPQGEDDDPTSVQEFKFAVANGYKGTYDQFKTLGPRITADAMAGLRAAQTDGANRTNDYNLPPPASSTGGGVSVTAPNGQVFVFPNQKAADNFKARAGIK